MRDKLYQMCASDKDIFDLLMSDQNKFSENTLRAVALERGILLSLKLDREDIAREISLLTHDYSSLVKLIGLREHSRRTEKMTNIRIPVSLTRDELTAIAIEYRDSRPDDEKVTFQPRRSADIFLNVEYNEYDYSRTRLIQRQRHDAGIEFISDGENLTIRMPATEKANVIVEDLRNRISDKKRETLVAQSIDLSSFSSEERSKFFLFLIRGVDGFPLETVVSVKVSSRILDADTLEVDTDFEEEREAPDDVIAIVNSVALSGTNLLASDHYQNLREKGFFITSLTWHAKQSVSPYDRMQFTAAFENVREGKGFKYGVRISKRLTDGEYTKTFSAVEENRKPGLWRLVEAASWSAVSSILTERINLPTPSVNDGGLGEAS